MYANDYTGAKTEFARINSTITNSSLVSGNDGALNIWAAVNGTISNVFTFNGADNENNSFRPLDLTGNALKTSSGTLPINTTASTGTGIVSIEPKAGAFVNIVSPTSATNYIRSTPQSSTNSNRFAMSNTEAGTSFINSIDLLNNQYAPQIELKADFSTGGSINKSINIVADGTNYFNSITAYDGQSNNPFQIIANNPSGNGSIELKVTDSNGDLIFTGENIETANAGSQSSYLRIKLNGRYYKIALLAD
jgi:hypothetical protein